MEVSYITSSLSRYQISLKGLISVIFGEYTGDTARKCDKKSPYELVNLSGMFCDVCSMMFTLIGAAGPELNRKTGTGDVWNWGCLQGSLQ